MKRALFLSLVILLASTSMNASLGLKIGVRSISGDTEMKIDEYETDPMDPGKITMSWAGTMTYKDGPLTVYVQRSKAGMNDQLCAIQCRTGNMQLLDTMSYELNLAEKTPYDITAEYYSTSTDISDTIRYHFVGGGDDFTLTVIFEPKSTPVATTKESKKATKIIRNGQVVIIKEGKQFNLLGGKL